LISSVYEFNVRNKQIVPGLLFMGVSRKANREMAAAERKTATRQTLQSKQAIRAGFQVAYELIVEISSW
jgi:hypothetical protein